MADAGVWNSRLDEAAALQSFAGRLLVWWDRHGRHDLPWQRDITPYRVWVSEIMLQQTQVATVERYYARFMQRFADLPTLAAAELDDVLHHWSGLGYYSRARNLHTAARRVLAEHGGELPRTLEALQALPGIGRSTAAAVLALCHRQRQPILDGNVKRVLARWAAVEGWPGSTAALNTLWALADACTPATRVDHYTQAIMDLGATLCTRARPRCAECPVQADCLAHLQNRVQELPASRPRRTRPQRATVLLLLRRSNGEVLLQRRPPNGIWGGLWSFPEFDSTAAALEWCQGALGSSAQSVQQWPVVAHAFSHFNLAMTPLEAMLAPKAEPVMEDGRWLWYNTAAPQAVGLAAPVARLLQQMTGSEFVGSE